MNYMSKQYLVDILKKTFPPIEFAFAYGSGVFKQAGYSKNDKPMIDLVFVIKNAEEWHRENLYKNPKHYSGLKYLGASTISMVQKRFGARIYYNPFIDIDNQQFKYGVIDVDDLKEDLTKWTTLYVSGRLQKPVLILESNPQILEWQSKNLEFALLVSLFLIEKDTFTLQELFEAITKISYTGDIRMGIAENKNKVKNIVSTNIDQFKELYEPYIEKCSFIEKIDENLYQFVHPSPCPTLELPENLERKVRHHASKVIPIRDTTWIQELLKQPRVKINKIFSDALHDIVSTSSKTQSFKGLLTAGLRKSFVYALRKFNKAMQ